jgi:hypothetical protein
MKNRVCRIMPLNEEVLKIVQAVGFINLIEITNACH